MNRFKEPEAAGNAHRAHSLAQLDELLAQRQSEANVTRREFFAPRLDSPQHYEADAAILRLQFAQMLGWPLCPAPVAAARRIEESFVGEDDLGRIYRLRIPGVGPLDLYGLLFVPPGDGPFPLVLAQHGGLGTPELAAGLAGNSANYHDMARRPMERGAMVFAPQLFLTWGESAGPNRDQAALDTQLQQLGGSRAALELALLTRALDVFCARSDVDSQRIGMIGLSYGGFYTLALAALDVRIKVALSSCFFNDRHRYNWSDWVWKGSARRFLDAEIASLVCPRALWIEIGERDELFAANGAQEPMQAVQARYEALGIASKLGFKCHAHGHDDGLGFLAAHAPRGNLRRHRLSVLLGFGRVAGTIRARAANRKSVGAATQHARGDDQRVERMDGRLLSRTRHAPRLWLSRSDSPRFRDVSLAVAAPSHRVVFGNHLHDQIGHGARAARQ